VSVNRELRDRAIRHAIFLQRIKGEQANAILRMMDRELYPELKRLLAARLAKMERIGTDTGPVTTARLRELSDNVKKLTGPKMRKTLAVLQTGIQNVAGTEAEWQVKALRDAAPITLDLNMPSPETMKALVTAQPMQGRLMGEWWSGVESNLQKGIQSTIQVGVAAGKTTPQIIRDLNGGEGGPLVASRAHAQAIARTAVNHYANAARQETYKENSDVIKGWQFVATLDDRTTIECSTLDGQEFDLDDTAHQPPIHWNCRSTTVPIVKSFEELGIDAKELPEGERASMDGQVPETVTMEEFLTNKGEEFQNEVLGPGRAEIFRGGKVPFAKFIDQDLKPLSLAQLRVLEGMPPLPGPDEPPLPPGIPEPVPDPPPLKPPPPPPRTPVEQIDDAVAKIEAKIAELEAKQAALKAEMDALLEQAVAGEGIDLLDALVGQNERLIAVYGSKAYKDLEARHQRTTFAKNRIVANATKSIHAMAEVSRPSDIPFGNARPQANAVTGAEWLRDHVHADIFPGETMPDIFTRMLPEKSRAFYRPSTRTVNLTRDDNIGTAVHEISHAIELSSPNTKARIADFLLRRALADPNGPRRLSELTGNTNYGPDEWAFEDQFPGTSKDRELSYIGRWYAPGATGATRRYQIKGKGPPLNLDDFAGATEVLSMGMEQFYNDPMNFRKNDPEYFRLIVELMGMGR
jgi:SPP1 gp7 family putative phage head morphogenesis protein